MSKPPKEIWCSTGLYYEYKTDWSEGEWSVRPDLSHIKYVRADHIEELERNILAAERRLKRLARWLDLSDEELKNLTIGSIVNDYRKMQADVNAAIAALKGENDGY
jgi:hypothetical protein